MAAPSVAAEIGLCLLLSAADGEISDEELGALTTRVGELLGDDFAPSRLTSIVDGELSNIADVGADDYVAKLPERIPEARRFEAVAAACAIACADGLSPEEEEMLRLAANALAVDVDKVIERVGRKDTIHMPVVPDLHDDEPDEITEMIGERLGKAGWTDPMQELRTAGIKVGGFGALALHYTNPPGHVLRLEHHPCDGSIHLHLTGADDASVDFVLYPDGRDAAVTERLAEIQDVLDLDNVEQHMTALMQIARVRVVRNT